MKIAEAMENYLVYLMAEKGDSKKTIDAYENDLHQFLRFTKKEQAEKLTLLDYEDHLAYLTSEGLSKASLSRKATTIKGFYRFLKNEGVITVSLGEMELPKRSIRLPRTLSDQEIRKLFGSVSTESYKGLLNLSMMELCYSCGLRVSELCNLKIDQANVQDGYLKIRGKGDKERMVPMNRECQSYLTLYLKERKALKKTKGKNLFLHQDGSPVSRQYFFLALRKYGKEAGLGENIHPHMLRHSFATTLLENGAPIRQVQELLGHSKVETTMIYTQVSTRLKREGYDKAMDGEKGKQA